MIKINGKDKEVYVKEGDLVRNYDDDSIGIVVQNYLPGDNSTQRFNVIDFLTDKNTLEPRYGIDLTAEEITEDYKILSSKENYDILINY